MEKLLKKKIYKVIFKLQSPLSIGSGDNEQTDRDIIKNSLGIPYIPGSALAGVGRETARTIFGEESDEKERTYFGDIARNENEQNTSSRIIFYDGTIKEDTHYISNRDSVELDKWKTAMDGHKFDMEILEPGITIVTYIEQNYYNENERDIVTEILQYWYKNAIYMGAKTMRGYGAMQLIKSHCKEFDFTKVSLVEKWLDFDMYTDASWDDSTEVEPGEDTGCAPDRIEIKLGLKQVGGISIRRYTTQAATAKNKPVPDYEQLTVHYGEDALPTIPGTSWAGAFRHRMISLNKECDKKELWGCADPDKKMKSSIRFSETRLSGAKAKQISRNAIDRFSGGTVDTALFTEKTYYGGTTELIISVDRCVEDSVKNTLAAAIADLHNGFLAIGGLTAVGRGLFEVRSVNGTLISKDVYQEVRDVMNQSGKEV